MNSLLKGHLLLLLVLLLHSTSGQELGEACLTQFKQGRDDFILDADESVKDGATFISSPKLDRYKDCVTACCKEPKCNVAFMERGAEKGLVSSCFLFNCLYKQKYACRFVRKKGYINYILDSVYDSYLERDVPSSKNIKHLQGCVFIRRFHACHCWGPCWWDYHEGPLSLGPLWLVVYVSVQLMPFVLKHII